MAISTAQYIDLLFKKLNGVAKTATAAQKSSSNESIASPPLLRGDIVWTQSDQIPSSAQVVAGITQGYLTTSRIECVPDTTVPTIGGIYPTWLTNLTDWIPQEFGSTWPVKIYVDTAGAANPTVTGTQIFSPGIGGAGEFFFDTQAGLLNFIGETIPSTLTAGKSIFVVGYRYVGLLGVTNLPDGTSIGNLQITGNTIVSLNANGDIVLDPNGTGQVVISANLSVSSNVVAGNISTVGIANVATLAVTGNANIVGNITGSYFLGNGAFLTGIDATSIQNGNSNVRVTANGNVTVGVAGTSNVVVFANTGAFVTGIVSVTGNITANGILTNNYYYANGTPVDFEQPAGSNTQIQFNNNNNFGASGALVFDSASNIFTVGGNIVGNTVSTNAVTSTGQLTVSSAVNGNILLDPDGTGIFKIVGTNGFVVPVGNTTQRPDYPTYAAVDTGTLRLNNTLNQLEIWNGAIWSIVGSDSGNISVIDQQITPDGSSTAYVLTQVATAASIIVSLNGVVQIPNDGYTVTGNSLTFIEPPLTTDIVDIRFLTGVNAPSVLYNSSGNSSVQVTDTPDIVTTVNNVVKSRVNAVGLSVTGNITASGNIAGTYFIGNGAFLTGISGSSYGNANVVANLAALGSNPISTTANISGGNILGNGRQLTGIVSSYGNANVVTLLSGFGSNTIATTGNVSAGNVLTSAEVIASGVIQSGTGLSTGGYLSVNGTTDLHDTNVIGTLSVNVIKSDDSTIVQIQDGLDVDGNVTADYFVGNGSQLTGISTANTGNVTFDDNIVIGTGSNDGTSGLYLAPGNASIANSAVQYLRVRGGDVVTHIHLDTGNNQYYDQYFGDDGKYVKLANTGNVVIGSDDAVGNSAQWTFGTSGNLTLPRGGVVYETNIPDGGLNGNTITLKPSGGTNADQQLLIYPTTNDANHLHLTTGNLYSTELFLGDDNLYVKLANTGNIVISSDDAVGNTAQWTFGTDGLLTFPTGNLVITPDDPAGNIASIVSTDHPLGILSTGANGAVASLWVEDYANVVTSNIAAVYANPTPGSKIVRIAVGQNGSPGLNLWDFDAAGNLTAPGNINSSGNISSGNVLTTGVVSATGNVSGNYFIGNGSQLTGVAASYGNANVVANLAALGSNPISTTGNITAGNLIGNISITGNVTGTSANVSLVAGSYSTVFDNTGAATFPGNITTSGNISATGSILATPAWTSAGAITLTATTTNPTKGTTTYDNISYRQLGAKQWEVVMTYIQTVANGVNGSGDYLVTLPNGLSFDTTLPSQQIYTTGVGTSTFAHLTYVIPNCNGTINNGTLGAQIFPMIYSATKFRILTLTYGSGIQCWGSGFYSIGGDDPQIQLTFRFTST